MKQRLVGLFDTEAGILIEVHKVQNAKVAVRELDQAVNDDGGKSMLCKYPEQFTLLDLGEIDIATCQIDAQVTKIINLAALVNEGAKNGESK